MITMKGRYVMGKYKVQWQSVNPLNRGSRPVIHSTVVSANSLMEAKDKVKMTRETSTTHVKNVVAVKLSD